MYSVQTHSEELGNIWCVSGTCSLAVRRNTLSYLCGVGVWVCNKGGSACGGREYGYVS